MQFQHFGDWSMKNGKFETATQYVQGQLGLYRKIMFQKITKTNENKIKYLVSKIQWLDSLYNKYSWKDSCLIGQ